MITTSLTTNMRLIRKLDSQVFLSTDEEINPNHTWWVTKVDGVPSAYASATFASKFGYVYLSRAGVLPAFRGKKLHTKLLWTRLGWAASVGAHEVLTYTVPYNTPSQNNLIKVGFKTYTPEKRWAGTEMVYWRLEL